MTKKHSIQTLTGDSRVFLGLDQPPLVAATDWFCQRFRQEKSGTFWLDMSELIVVVPTARAQTRLLQMLVARTDAENIIFSPPMIATLGQLPEFLYVAEKALASDLTQQLAWSKALQETPVEEIKQLTGHPDVEEIRDWQPLAAMISKLHSRLANDIWSFSSVARAVSNDTGFLQQEAERWEVLKKIQSRYYKILEGVDRWDKQAARNFAAGGLLKADQIRCSTDKTIVMLGAADLNRSISEMLRQVKSTNPAQVQILVAAAESQSQRFDEFGSLITQQWIGVPIEIPDQKIRIVDQPADQAFAAVHFVTHLHQYATDEITIGVPDDSLVPQVKRTLNSINLASRFLAGRPLAETGPVRLLIACREYLQTFTYDSFAALVRHPDMFRWLCEQVEAEHWLTDLAIFQNENLPLFLRLDEKNPFGNVKKIAARFDPTDKASKKRAINKSESVDVLNRLHRRLSELLSPLESVPQSIGNWAEPWSQVLIEIYGSRLLDKTIPADRQIIVACQSIYEALDDQRQVPEAFGVVASAIQSLEWALQSATEQRVSEPACPEAIVLAGWLDLALDDAPAIVVTGMNDENVPTSEVGHPFLPNELCKQLGILDNDRRFARDCYALGLITTVRDDYLLIAGRRDEAGESLKPSRLFFADDAATAARRAKAFFSYRGKTDSKPWLTNAQTFASEQQFIIPPPVVTKPVTQISVTKFRDFIKCPYRFYLNHLLRLESIADDERELDGGKFGDLTHNCLEAFGKSDIRDTTSVGQIYDFLNDQLNQLVKQQFGASRLPAVEIQVEQLRLRFERFATIQSARRASGWLIVSTEEMLEHDFVVDGTPFNIRGKIDRVDQHEITQQIAVWDYKSSDAGSGPEKVHYAPRKKEWKDLQLPLYRHLVKEVSAVAGGDFSNVMMGYVLLPKKLDDVDFYEAQWSPEQLATADETARDIIRKLRAGKFWLPNPNPPLFSEDYAAICQDRVFEQFLVL